MVLGLRLGSSPQEQLAWWNFPRIIIGFPPEADAETMTQVQVVHLGAKKNTVRGGSETVWERQSNKGSSDTVKPITMMTTGAQS